MIRSGKKRGAATLDDVGRLAGVSVGTASIVLNRPWSSKQISAGTSARVRAAATQLCYRPNLAARGLLNRRMHTLGVASAVADGEFNHYSLAIFSGIVAAAAARGENTTAFMLRDWQEAPERLREFCDGRIDGMILLAPTFDRTQALPEHTPFVSIHANHPLPGVINIESDEEAGAFALTQHLIARGHERILHLAGPAGLIGAERRIRGYTRAVAAARLPLDPALLVRAGYTVALGRAAMRGWLRANAGARLPHAVFCANDAVAIGCAEALAEAGWRVPDDISVAGFDDSFVARAVTPPLTSVRQPLQEMGARAVKLLLAGIGRAAGGPRRSPRPVVFPVELALRASVSVPPRTDRLVSARAGPGR